MEMNGIAVIGAGMIGAAHASGYRLQLPRFAGQIDGIHLATICDSDRDLAERMATTYGFGRVSDDWTSVIADPSIAVPGGYRAATGPIPRGRAVPAASSPAPFV